MGRSSWGGTTSISTRRTPGRLTGLAKGLNPGAFQRASKGYPNPAALSAPYGHPIMLAALALGEGYGTARSPLVAITGMLVSFGLPLLLVAIILVLQAPQAANDPRDHREAGRKGPAGAAGAAGAAAAPGHSRTLRGGLVLVALGIALAIFFAEVGAPWSIGLIPGLMGVALLLAWRIENAEAKTAAPPLPMRPAAAPTDADLILAVLERDDRRAFAELVHRHQSQVRTVLRRLTRGDVALADDLAQETFVLAWRNLRHFRFEARFSTWLYRIAFNAWQSEARKKREVLLDLDPTTRRRPDRTPSTDMPDMASRIDLERAMATLSDGERAAIAACYYADLSHEEAAAALGMPRGHREDPRAARQGQAQGAPRRQGEQHEDDSISLLRDDARAPVADDGFTAPRDGRPARRARAQRAPGSRPRSSSARPRWEACLHRRSPRGRIGYCRASSTCTALHG